MVVATKPGTSVPVKVLRNKQEKTLNVTVDELDLEAEQNGGRRTPQPNEPPQPPEQQGAGSFGLTLDNVTPQMARRLRLPSGQTGAVVTEVDPDGAVGRRAAPGRRDPVGERQGGVERRRSGARAAEDRSRAASRSCASGAATSEVFVAGEEGMSRFGLQIADCRLLT